MSARASLADKLSGLAVLALLLSGCATASSAETPLSIPIHTQSTADFRLMPVTAALQGETIRLRGALCRRFNSETLSPRRLVVVGYDEAHRALFRREVGVAPLLARTEDNCHSFAARLPVAPVPSEIEVRAIPFGADAPP